MLDITTTSSEEGATPVPSLHLCCPTVPGAARQNWGEDVRHHQIYCGYCRLCIGARDEGMDHVTLDTPAETRSCDSTRPINSIAMQHPAKVAVQCRDVNSKMVGIGGRGVNSLASLRITLSIRPLPFPYELCCLRCPYRTARSA